MNYTSAALDAWASVVDGYMTEQGARYLDGFNDSLATSGMSMGEDPLRTVLSALAQADIYSTRPDVVDLCAEAQKTVPHHPVLASDEVPSRVGFVYLAKPFRFLDKHRQPMAMHAFTWWPTYVSVQTGPEGKHLARSAGFAVSTYARLDDLQDHYSVKYQEMVASGQIPGFKSPWQLSSITAMPADQSIVPDEDLVELRLPEAGEHWHDDGADPYRFMLTWWAVVREKLTAVNDEMADRASRRRVERLGVPKGIIRPIKVVDLNRNSRPPSANGPAAAVDWSHRWVVRPHWRRQWYPSTQEHKLKLILPYVKGPDNKPLVVKTTIFDVKE